MSAHKIFSYVNAWIIAAPAWKLALACVGIWCVLGVLGFAFERFVSWRAWRKVRAQSRRERESVARVQRVTHTSIGAIGDGLNAVPYKHSDARYVTVEDESSLRELAKRKRERDGFCILPITLLITITGALLVLSFSRAVAALTWPRAILLGALTGVGLLLADKALQKRGGWWNL